MACDRPRGRGSRGPARKRRASVRLPLERRVGGDTWDLSVATAHAYRQKLR